MRKRSRKREPGSLNEMAARLVSYIMGVAKTDLREDVTRRKVAAALGRRAGFADKKVKAAPYKKKTGI